MKLPLFCLGQFGSLPMKRFLLAAALFGASLAHGEEAAPGAVLPSETKSDEQIRWESIVYPKYRTWPAMKYVKEDPALPNALIIGDSISIGYTASTREALAGKVNVFRIPANGGSTKVGLENLEQWLAWREKWDVIHFNFGLHDLWRRKPRSADPDNPDVMADVPGENQVPVEEYARNLEKIVARLQTTGARLVWASTTPVPPGPGDPDRIQGDEVKYNEAAEKVMKKHGVPTDDLYAFIKPHLAMVQKPPDVHFEGPGYKLLGEQVAAEILAALSSKAPPAR